VPGAAQRAERRGVLVGVRCLRGRGGRRGARGDVEDDQPGGDDRQRPHVPAVGAGLEDAGDEARGGGERGGQRVDGARAHGLEVAAQDQRVVGGVAHRGDQLEAIGADRDAIDPRDRDHRHAVADQARRDDRGRRGCEPPRVGAQVAHQDRLGQRVPAAARRQQGRLHAARRAQIERAVGLAPGRAGHQLALHQVGDR
jgi:hypothetical protein